MKCFHIVIFSFLTFLVCHNIMGQENKQMYSGKIVDGKGNPLQGVIITKAKEAIKPIVSNEKGEFLLLANKGERVIFTLNNIKKKSITLSGSEEITVFLDEESVLVPMGHGRSTSKDKFAGSAQSLAGGQINTSVQSAANGLYGKLSGLWTLQNSGPPSKREPNMAIRGISTMGDRSILVLVNGYERPLSSVNIEEIESYTVLKDAAAKAIYGQRAANGVLLINTKKGYVGKTVFQASMDGGVKEAVRLPGFVDAATYAQNFNEARANDGLEAGYSDLDIARYASGEYPYLYPNVNWMNEVMKRHALMSRFNFNAKGGNELIEFFTNFNFQTEEGFYKNTGAYPRFSTQEDYKQFNFRSFGRIKASSSTVIDVDLAAMFRDFTEPGNGDIYGPANRLPSNAFPVRNADGSWGGTNLYGNNPVARLSNTGNELLNTRDVFLTTQIKQRLNFVLKGLSATVKIGYDGGASFSESQKQAFIYKQITPVLDENGEIVSITETQFGQESDLNPSRSVGSYHTTNSNLEGRLNYATIVGAGELNALLFFHQQQQRRGTSNQTYRWQNLAGSVNYLLHGKYIFDLAFSYNGSNRIQRKEDRWGFFPAISAAWLLSKEHFLENTRLLDFLKVRGSYGQTGNGLITMNKLTYDQYGGGGGWRFGVNNNSVGGTSQTNLGIPLKTFERNNEANFGIDSRWFDLLDISADLYYMRRKNILVGADGAISSIFGISPGVRPNGEVENKGIELTVGISNKIGGFNYGLKGNFAYSKNRIINQNEVYRPFQYLKREGKAIGQYFGLEDLGFFSSQDDIANSPVQVFGIVSPGDIKYVDQNNDGMVNGFDQVAIGHSWFPEIYYGADLNVGYKGLSLSATFQGIGRASVSLSNSNLYKPFYGGNGNMSTWYTNYWTSDNAENATLPRLTTEQNQNNYQTNSIWVRNGAFLKLRYLELAYQIPNGFLKKFKLSGARIYLRGRDLFSWDKLGYTDPEYPNASYPLTRFFNVGGKFNF